MSSAQFVFQAVKGIQANMEYFATMVPLDCLSKLFIFNNEDLPPELRAQRILNKARIPAICDYIIKNPTSYVFSALTASVDGNILFTPIDEKYPSIGTITIDFSSKLLINDGQHRYAAIKSALKLNPDLKYEHIPVILYHDLGLKRSQQMFSDLNKFALRPTHSLNIMYDNRDADSKLVKDIIANVPVFKGLVDTEHTSISNRSNQLFTLSGLHRGTKALFSGLPWNYEKKREIGIIFWNVVSEYMQDWKDVYYGKTKAYAIRQNSLSSLSITIKGLGAIGNEILHKAPETINTALSPLSQIDWHKNGPLWKEGIVVNGSVVSSRATQKMMENILCNAIRGAING
jgi:DNA sulfur modification protein DndB